MVYMLSLAEIQSMLALRKAPTAADVDAAIVGVTAMSLRPGFAATLDNKHPPHALHVLF